MPRSVGVVGDGRMGRALAAALAATGVTVHGPAGREQVPAGEAIVLCVPDAEIPAAAAAVAGAAPLVGHTSGATPLSALAGSGGEAFGLHPLQSFPAAPEADPLSAFAGAGCAVGGTSARAAAVAGALARRLGMEPFALADESRAAYHAAASTASNFLVTLEDAAEQLAGHAGLPPATARRVLEPLVRTTVANWAALGPEAALTGPVARGDEATVLGQRRAVAAADPDLLDLFDALVARTHVLAARAAAVPA